MRRILLLMAVLLAQTMSAQLFYGESRSFGLEGYVARPSASKADVLGCIRHYIGEKGESSYIQISIPHSKEKIEISRNNNVYIEFANNRYSRSLVHSIKTEKLSKQYAKEKLYDTLLECPVDESELCKRRIKSISIETDNGDEFIIRMGWFWGTYLSKAFPDYFAEAKKDAQKRKERREFLTETYGEDIPEEIKVYLQEKYPEQSYNITLLDTVYMPFRAIAMFDYAIKETTADLLDDIAEAQEAGNAYTHLLEKGDSIVREFRKELSLYEDEYEYPYAAEGGEDDYQRVVIELVNYNGKECVTIFTRVGEDLPTEFDFGKEADECRAGINGLQESIERLRKRDAENAGMIEE